MAPGGEKHRTKISAGRLSHSELFAMWPVHFVTPKSPESEILAKFLADAGGKCGEKLAKKFSPHFRPSISRKSGRKKFDEKSSTNPTSHETKFFCRKTLGAWGHKL